MSIDDIFEKFFSTKSENKPTDAEIALVEAYKLVRDVDLAPMHAAGLGSVARAFQESRAIMRKALLAAALKRSGVKKP